MKSDKSFVSNRFQVLNVDLSVSFRKPGVRFAFFVVMSVCVDHERSSAMVTPSNVAVEILYSST